MELGRLPKIKVSKTLQYTMDDDVDAPITGHEIRQSCKRHTVYKIYVHFNDKQGWFLHRRYREFNQLKTDLAKLFPAKEFTLPPKRYFGDNFEPRFLNSRRQGLQGFLYMITRQKDVVKSQPVAEFLALNNPPSAKDDLEQSRAVIEKLEETVEKLRAEKTDHDTNLSSSNGQIVELHEQKQAVLAALRYERQQNGRKHYLGDDLSLMFEYRSLPEVCRVDVSSFLIRKPPGYLARKFEDKTRKFEDKTRKFEDKTRKFEDKTRKEDVRSAREYENHGSSVRPRTATPPIFEHGRYDYDVHKDRAQRNSKPHVEIQLPPKSAHKKQFSSSENVNAASSKPGEFQSFYDVQRRRKSMPGALEFHTVSNLLKKSVQQPKNDAPQQRLTSLTIPHNARPRSFSALSMGDSNTLSSVQEQISAMKLVKKQTSLETPKKGFGWSSLKDLSMLKGRV